MKNKTIGRSSAPSTAQITRMVTNAVSAALGKRKQSKIVLRQTKKKRTASKTKTMKKKKFSTGYADTSDGHMSYSKTLVKAGKVSYAVFKLLKAIGLRKEIWNGTTVYTSTVGRQHVSDGHAFKSYTRAGVIEDWDLLNTQTPNSNTNFSMQSWTNNWLFANTSNQLTFVWIYDLMCIRSTAHSPTILWDKALEAKYGSSSGRILAVDASPAQAGTVFTQHWKIRKITKLVMSPGSHHQHVYHVNYGGRIITGPQIQTDNNNYLAGITPDILIRMHGCIGGEVGSNRTIMASELVGVCKASRSYKKIENSFTQFQRGSDLETTTASAKIIDVDDGQIELAVTL